MWLGFTCKEKVFSKPVLCSNVLITLSQIIYRILFRPVFERFQIIPCEQKRKFHINRVYLLLFLIGIIYKLILGRRIHNATFHQRLKPIIYVSIKIPIYFVKGNRKLFILHARIRNNCRYLKSIYFVIIYLQTVTVPVKMIMKMRRIIF